MNDTSIDLTPQNAAPVWRRLAAIVYDSLILIALWMFATALALPLSKGEALAPGNWWLRLYLLLVAMIFFVYFWKRAGQTLGMRVWKIKIISVKPDTKLNILQLLIRFMIAILSWSIAGLGFAWCFFNPQKSALHDLVSKTRLVLVTDS